MGAALQPDRRALARPLELKLSTYGTLSSQEVELVRTGVSDVRSHRSGSQIARSFDEVELSARIVLSGWVAWTAQLMDGRRQIICLALPGDLLEPPPAGQLALIPAVLEPARTADASALLKIIEEDAGAGLAKAWRLAERAAHARQVLQMLRLGRLSAYERVASFLVELHERQRRAGLADEAGMPLPLTQEVLADALGLSVVHVNRTLQQLRREELIVSHSGRVVFPDIKALARATMQA
jgi:CRP-like cAMP-binding protein